MTEGVRLDWKVRNPQWNPLWNSIPGRLPQQCSRGKKQDCFKVEKSPGQLVKQKVGQAGATHGTGTSLWVTHLALCRESSRGGRRLCCACCLCLWHRYSAGCACADTQLRAPACSLCDSKAHVMQAGLISVCSVRRDQMRMSGLVPALGSCRCQHCWPQLCHKMTKKPLVADGHSRCCTVPELS